MPDHKTKFHLKTNFLRSLNPAERKEGLYCIRGGYKLLDLSRNDYLNLNKHPDLIESAKQVLTLQGMGSSGSRLLSGDDRLFHQLEGQLADFFNCEASLLFNSGYQCNVSVISALYGKNDIVFADKHIHASLIDGCRLAGVTLKRFSHNNTKHLSNLLVKYRHLYDKSLILSESLFSMDGDCSDIECLIMLKKKFNCELFIDDAHAFAVMGEHAKGLAFEKANDIDFIAATFGKALASSGAFLICSKYIKDQLISSARGFMYSTALPLPVIAWNTHALNLISTLNDQKKQLLALALWLREQCSDIGFSKLGNSYIIPLIFKTPSACKQAALSISKAAYHAPIILPPTVAANSCRIRLSLSAAMTKTDLLPLINCLKSLKNLIYEI